VDRRRAARIGEADELEHAARRPDGALRPAVKIWVDAVDGELYVRSWRRPQVGWYRAARDHPEGHVSAGGVQQDVAFSEADHELNDAIDAAYREKYGRYTDYVGAMVRDKARATTLRLVPQPSDGKHRRQ
jgi:hypothetical protein